MAQFRFFFHGALVCFHGVYCSSFIHKSAYIVCNGKHELTVRRLVFTANRVFSYCGSLPALSTCRTVSLKGQRNTCIINEFRDDFQQTCTFWLSTSEARGGSRSSFGETLFGVPIVSLKRSTLNLITVTHLRMLGVQCTFRVLFGKRRVPAPYEPTPKGASLTFSSWTLSTQTGSRVASKMLTSRFEVGIGRHVPSGGIANGAKNEKLRPGSLHCEFTAKTEEFDSF